MYYFVRTTPKAITNANIANEVNFGSIDTAKGGLLKGIENLLSSVFIPALKAQGSWGALTEEIEEEKKTSPVVTCSSKLCLFHSTIVCVLFTAHTA